MPRKLIISFIIIIVLLSGYFIAAKYYFYTWPFSNSSSVPTPSTATSTAPAFCKVQADSYLNKYGETHFGIETVKNSVDYPIYAPSYVPATLKQVCPIKSEVIQAGLRVVTISFYQKSLNTNNIKNYGELISQFPATTYIDEKKLTSENDPEQLQSTLSKYWNFEKIRIGNNQALYATYKPDAITSNPRLNPNKKILYLFMPETNLNIYSDELSKEELIKIAESFKPL